jgi:hypothetical protein
MHGSESVWVTAKFVPSSNTEKPAAATERLLNSFRLSQTLPQAVNGTQQVPAVSYGMRCFL